jgi:hypothetical protein
MRSCSTIVAAIMVIIMTVTIIGIALIMYVTCNMDCSSIVWTFQQETSILSHKLKLILFRNHKFTLSNKTNNARFAELKTWNRKTGDKSFMWNNL